MDFLINFDTVNCKYIGDNLEIVCFSLYIVFVLANSVDPDEIPRLHYIWVLTVCQSTRLGFPV